MGSEREHFFKLLIGISSYQYNKTRFSGWTTLSVGSLQRQKLESAWLRSVHTMGKCVVTQRNTNKYISRGNIESLLGCKSLFYHSLEAGKKHLNMSKTAIRNKQTVNQSPVMPDGSL